MHPNHGHVVKASRQSKHTPRQRRGSCSGCTVNRLHRKFFLPSLLESVQKRAVTSTPAQRNETPPGNQQTPPTQHKQDSCTTADPFHPLAPPRIEPGLVLAAGCSGAAPPSTASASVPKTFCPSLRRCSPPQGKARIVRPLVLPPRRKPPLAERSSCLQGPTPQSSSPRKQSPGRRRNTRREGRRYMLMSGLNFARVRFEIGDAV